MGFTLQFFNYKLLCFLVVGCVGNGNSQWRESGKNVCGRRDGQMVSELDSGLSGLGSSPGQGHVLCS